MKKIRVAIDGPAGAGKSTVARALAERLGYLLLDTGALYRTVALAAKRAGIEWDEREAVGELAERLVGDGAITVARGGPSAAGGSGMIVYLRGEDVSRTIREPEMSLGASAVSAIPRVRAALLDMQRRAGREGGVVLEGRDIGTVVMPDAEAKFFLTASPEVRARRRVTELAARGTIVSFDATLSDVVKRDRADSERPIAPLKQASDAILVDSSNRDVDVILDEMVKVVEERAR